jgi:hypothetical protein
MMDIVLSLVFAAPLLILMAYPAMKITEYIETKIEVDVKLYNKLTVSITIVLSLIFGTLLQVT